MLMFVTPIRRGIGPSYFSILITTACANGGMAVGANMELQLQQLLMGIVVSAYILFVQAVVYALGKNSSVNFDVAARVVHGVALAMYCYFIATIYTRVPRFSLPMKINIMSPFLAFTNYPAARGFSAQPLPGIIYGQLIGAAVPTLVNIFVLPSTSSRKLMGAFRVLLKEMAGCCEYFEEAVDTLGKDGCRRSSTASKMRVSVRGSSERYGQLVGGTRYKITIERFSQSDHRQMFIEANRLAASFSTMCLPFEIDDDFRSHLQPSTKFASETKEKAASSQLSVSSTSTSISNDDQDSSHQEDKQLNSSILQSQHEQSREGAPRALGPIKAQLALHKKILNILAERASGMQDGSPSKALALLVADMLHLRAPSYPTDAGYANGGGDEEAASATAHDDSQLHLMNLGGIADIVDRRAELFEEAERAFIEMISPYMSKDDPKAHERQIVLLSFIGALRENAICLSNVLRVLHKMYLVRPNRVQVWFPKLSGPWLYRGRASEDKDEDENPTGEDKDLENAFGTSEEEEEEEGGGSKPQNSTRPESRGETAGSTERQQISEMLSPRRQRVASLKSACDCVVTSVAQVLLKIVDWLGTPKTQYAMKFTLTMMAWAVWSYFNFSQRFYIDNHGPWGLTSIGMVFNITIGSTFYAGLMRVLGTLISGAWAIVTWEASKHGSTPYLPCFCCAVYFAVSFYVSFFVPRWAPVTPVMMISFTSVFFTAYFDGSAAQGTTLGWERVAVNVVAILLAILVSAILMPYKARTALRKRLAEVLRLNTMVIQSINHMHMARAEFPLAHKTERELVLNNIYRSRVAISKCRGLFPAAVREPSVHGAFQVKAHMCLIDTLELQLEWLLYSYFTQSSVGGNMLGRTIRQTATLREDIIGAKSAFNSILASALHARSKLPVYLPNVGTARRHFVQHFHSLAMEQYSQSFEITCLSRWNIGIWHVIASQEDLCRAVRAIVGSEVDSCPDNVDQMISTLEKTERRRSGQGLGTASQAQPLVMGQWFRRLPKHAKTD
ncbi:hypothetical protein GQ54DRAFT_297951 [Martensiomyces pterosporus]|nr:hypothetical protein GQ54DRAFT_297951 [Martensiomyces pterosporus]